MNPIAACLSLLLAGCAAMPEAGTSIPDGSEFALVPGQSVLLADHSRLTYTRLVNDSRCAPGRRCVWEGDAELSLRWQCFAGAGYRGSAGPGCQRLDSVPRHPIVACAGAPAREGPRDVDGHPQPA